MGFGDELLGSGMARGAKARGKRIAFGDGRRIIWFEHSLIVYKGNPNVASPGSEQDRDIEWVRHYKAKRLYGRVRNMGWEWDTGFRAIPGEVYLTPAEIANAEAMPAGVIVIEPNVKRYAPNKRWSWDRYQTVADTLMRAGHRVVQFNYGCPMLHRVEPIPGKDFRTSVAMLSRAALYIGPEGGLHHGAAADKKRATDFSLHAGPTPAVVIFGGYIHPRTTGYDFHANLFHGDNACGNMTAECLHCRRAMQAIEVEQVLEAAGKMMQARAA